MNKEALECINNAVNSFNMGMLTEYEMNCQILDTMIKSANNYEVHDRLSDKLAKYQEAHQLMQDVDNFVNGAVSLIDALK